MHEVSETRRQGAGRDCVWAFLLVVQWPLAAVLFDPTDGGLVSTVDILALAFIAVAAAGLVLGARLGSAVLLGSSGLLALVGSYFCLRQSSLLVFCVVGCMLAATTALALRRARRDVPVKLAVLAAALLVGLAILELAAPAIQSLNAARTDRERIVGGPLTGEIEVPDRLALAQLLPSSTARAVKKTESGAIVFDVKYTIDAFAGRVVPGRPDAGGKWWLFGGSFTFGEGLNDDETIAAWLQKSTPAARILNFGVRNTAASDALIHLERKLESGAAPEWVVYLFIGDHFRRTALPLATRVRDPDRPRFVLDGGEAVYAGTAGTSFDGLAHQLAVNLGTRSALVRSLATWAPVDGDQRLVRALIERMSRRAGEAGSKFLLVSVPAFEDPWVDRSRAMVRSLESEGMTCVDATVRLEEHLAERGESKDAYYLLDEHPNPRLTALIAGWIRERIRAEELEPASPKYGG